PRYTARHQIREPGAAVGSDDPHVRGLALGASISVGTDTSRTTWSRAGYVQAGRLTTLRGSVGIRTRSEGDDCLHHDAVELATVADVGGREVLVQLLHPLT